MKQTISHKQKLTILLDLDDTAILYSNGKATEHPKLKELLDTYEVTLYSGNEGEIETYANKWNIKFIRKSENKTPSADVLIDNDYKLWKNLVSVKKAYSSIDGFLKAEKKKHNNKTP